MYKISVMVLAVVLTPMSAFCSEKKAQAKLTELAQRIKTEKSNLKTRSSTATMVQSKAATIIAGVRATHTPNNRFDDMQQLLEISKEFQSAYFQKLAAKYNKKLSEVQYAQAAEDYRVNFSKLSATEINDA